MQVNNKRKHGEEDTENEAVKRAKVEQAMDQAVTNINIPTKVPKKGTEVTLSPEDVKFCIRIGSERNAANTREGKTNRKKAKARDDTQISIQGVIGELAILRMFGLSEEDLSDTTCRNARNDTFDANVNGLKIDVKAVLAQVRQLLVTKWKKENPPDAYALVQIAREGMPFQSKFVETETVRVILHGFVGSIDLFQEGNLTVHDKMGQCYGYDLQDLDEWDDMVLDGCSEDESESEVEEGEGDSDSDSECEEISGESEPEEEEDVDSESGSGEESDSGSSESDEEEAGAVSTPEPSDTSSALTPAC